MKIVEKEILSINQFLIKNFKYRKEIIYYQLDIQNCLLYNLIKIHRDINYKREAEKNAKDRECVISFFHIYSSRKKQKLNILQKTIVFSTIFIYQFRLILSQYCRSNIITSYTVVKMSKNSQSTKPELAPTSHI